MHWLLSRGGKVKAEGRGDEEGSGGLKARLASDGRASHPKTGGETQTILLRPRPPPGKFIIPALQEIPRESILILGLLQEDGFVFFLMPEGVHPSHFTG